MAKTNLGSFKKRVLAALVMLPITIGIIYFGYPLVDMFVLIVGAVMAWEWCRISAKKDKEIYSLCYMLALAYIMSLCYMITLGASMSLVVSTMVYNAVMTATAITALTVFAWIKAKGEGHRFLIALGVPYISIGVGSLLWLYYVVGFYGMLWFFLMVWGVDIGGYIVGSSLKGPKLAPKISPNKTWSGLFGGIILSVALSVTYISTLNCFFDQPQNMSIQTFYMCVGAAIAIIAQIGDLIESAIKRTVGVKDSSNLIPGHGGMFDRIDGLIFAAPFVYLFFTLYFRFMGN